MCAAARVGGGQGRAGGEPGGKGSGECTPEDTFCSLPDSDEMFYVRAPFFLV